MVRFNKVIVGGNLVRDPEIRFLPSGLSVTNFTVAVNRSYRQENEQKEEVSYFDVVVFGKQGESCAEYLSKGRAVLVEGRLRQRRWESEEGQRRSKIEIVAQQVQFLGPAREGSKVGQKRPDTDIEAADEDIPF
ncbi:MAG: single-stranded DNA-binding protein [Deltaproteobacteria bacterium]|nr:single-stranded DNA-binding protein [Deltaproteobacteria bacterium]NIS77461.1 single-stranded DNA-binding protein [Deltaproteobacteria bacterium]